MEHKFICPFCKKPMVQFIQNASHVCTEHNFFVEEKNRTAYFSHKAPKYLKDSQVMLAEFKESDPVFVFSKYKLFEPGFRVEDCIFINARKKSEIIDCLELHKVKPEILQEWYLIAGEGIIAKGIVRTMYNSLKYKSESNCLIRTEILSPERQLWQIVVDELTADEYMELKGFEAVTAFFQPIPEATLQTLYHTFNSKVPDMLSDEQAMYTWIVCKPYINISWGSSYIKMQESLTRYLKAITNDLDEVRKPKTPELYPTIPKQIYEEIKDNFYNYMPSIAVNFYNFAGNSTFCILNHEYMNDVFEGNLKSGKVDYHIIAQNSNMHALSILWKRYYPDYCDRYGIEQKKAYLLKKDVEVPLDADDIVLVFWKTVAKNLH